LAGVAVLVGLVGLWAAGGAGGTGGPGVGGPFSLVDQSGAAATERVLRGKWSAVFFGYTYCPDVCPTTLAALGQATAALGPDARRFQVVFITVDPERDTPAVLASYLASPSFPKPIIGLTGTPGQIAAAAKAYHVFYQKAPQGSSYTVDHSAVIYLMDPAGRFVRPLDTGVRPADIAGQIRAAMRGA
jgi:protein SCO1/2